METLTRIHAITHATARTVALGLAACAALALSACGGVGGGVGAGGAGGSGDSHSVGGTVYGGQQPVTGSTVTLYAVGSTTPLGTATTDSSGHWSIASFSCASVGGSTTNIYAVASGGNPGLTGSVDNTALKLISLLGPCGDESGTFLPHSVNINEITTVATVYALNGFIATLPDDIHASASNSLGLIRAEQTVKQLADVASGKDGPAFAGGANAATAQKLNSLANSLAACVNTASGSSTACAELFACALPGASYSAGACTGGGGIPPSNTLQALLSIARNPVSVSMAGVYNVATTPRVFPSSLTAAPTDETLMLNFTGNGLNGPGRIAIDKKGNVWVANNGGNSLSEFSASGVPAVGSPFTGGGVTAPVAITIDASGNVWVANNGSISEFSASGVPAVGSPFTGGGLNAPFGIAIDPSGNVWAASADNNTVNEFNSSGVAISPSTGYTGGGLNVPAAIAIDPSGNVWTASEDNSTVNEFNSSGMAISPSTGYTGGGLNAPAAIAIDPSGNVWTASIGNNSVNEFNASGVSQSGTSGFTGGGVIAPVAIAIDASGNVWTASAGNNSVNGFDASGAPLSGSSGYTGGGLNQPVSIAVDASGNIWVDNQHNNSLTEIIGAATPTRTPLVAAINQGFAP